MTPAKAASAAITAGSRHGIRRRSDVGNRLRLFRLLQYRRQFFAGKIRINACLPQVKMIEIKLSQGAKPGHGGVLPGAKVSPEIAEARGVPEGIDCISPSSHSAFNSPVGLLQFVEQLRTLSGGKPTGFKLAIGHPWELFGIAKAMLETGITPDFIVVDGAEGGTGAAPVEFTDHVGVPLQEALLLVHNTLVGTGLRDKSRLARRARSSLPSISCARWRLVPTGAIRHAASCLRSAAFNRKAATPIAVRPALQRRIRCVSAHLSCPTRRNASPISTGTRSRRWPN
jgi:hypothetical protein